jgi:transposase-like protein
MLLLTTRVPGWLHRLSTKVATSVPLSPLATTRAHCPHCERDTAWAVHAMRGYYRCRQCGNNPLDEGAGA